jgi:hypothetical protein
MDRAFWYECSLAGGESEGCCRCARSSDQPNPSKKPRPPTSAVAKSSLKSLLVGREVRKLVADGWQALDAAEAVALV